MMIVWKGRNPLDTTHKMRKLRERAKDEGYVVTDFWIGFYQLRDIYRVMQQARPGQEFEWTIRNAREFLGVKIFVGSLDDGITLNARRQIRTSLNNVIVEVKSFRG